MKHQALQKLSRGGCGKQEGAQNFQLPRVSRQSVHKIPRFKTMMNSFENKTGRIQLSSLFVQLKWREQSNFLLAIPFFLRKKFVPAKITGQFRQPENNLARTFHERTKKKGRRNQRVQMSRVTETSVFCKAVGIKWKNTAFAPFQISLNNGGRGGGKSHRHTWILSRQARTLTEENNQG